VSPNEIDLLREVTIIIPTYEPTIFELERAIEYWRDTPVTVHVIEGSQNTWFPVGAISGCPNIVYFHLPRKPNQSPIAKLYENFVRSSELTNTRFCALGGTDDFYTISGLTESLNILTSHHSIDAVVGRVLTYRKKKKLFWYHKYITRQDWSDLESKSLQDRLSTGSSWFLYAVCRTESFNKFLKICYEEKKFSKICTNVHEWMFIVLCKAMFRTKYINSVQMVRQDNVSRGGKEQLTKTKPDTQLTWDEFIRNSPDEVYIDEIKSQLVTGFNEVTPITEHPMNLELAREQIRLAQLKALKIRTAPQKSKALKSVLGNILFFFLPGLNIFSDRPRRLKYLWRIPKYQYSAEQQIEVEKIEKLLLMPREELRLRANI
jgi:hypothetical protein